MEMGIKHEMKGGLDMERRPAVVVTTMGEKRSSSGGDLTEGTKEGDTSLEDGMEEGGGRYDRGPSYGREPCHRMKLANRRMEESSASSLQTLRDTVDLGQDISTELDRQAEALDRTERQLDEMQLNSDQSKRHMRNNKSPFGGVTSYFSRRKKPSDITDPNPPKGVAQAQAQAVKSGSSKGFDSLPPPSMASLKGTGNRVVDDNVDEMGKAVHQLKDIGELIGEQLDDSNAQLERIKDKVDRAVNKDIRRLL